MKIREINRLQRVRNKLALRWFPDDWFMPLEDLQRPKDWEKRVFKRRVERLRSLDAKIWALQLEGALKWRDSL